MRLGVHHDGGLVTIKLQHYNVILGGVERIRCESVIEKDDEFIEEFTKFLHERAEARRRRESRRLVIPPELKAVREMAGRAILPIKPAGAKDQSETPPSFRTVRTEAGKKLPPYYLIYFLFVDVLRFRSEGPYEKMSWSVTIDFEGAKYTIAHVKSGLHLFAREGVEWERKAGKIVGLIHRGVSAAKPIFKWMADNAISTSKINVRNVGRALFERYIYFRNAFRAGDIEASALKNTHEIESRQRQFAFPLYSTHLRRETATLSELSALFTHSWLRMSEDASWLALAAIEAFFGWTEHIFIHLAILQGRVTSGTEVAEVAGGDWGTKFKKALDMNDRVTKKHFDRLVTIRRQLRNFMAHGAFGKGGEAFSFHSGAGAVPVALDRKRVRTQLSLTPELAFDDSEAIAFIEEFISFLWSGTREPARIYIHESDLPLVLPFASDGTYSAAMASVEAMREYVDHAKKEWDRAANMEW
jgi:hypothetical protein